MPDRLTTIPARFAAAAAGFFFLASSLAVWGATILWIPQNFDRSLLSPLPFYCLVLAHGLLGLPRSLGSSSSFTRRRPIR